MNANEPNRHTMALTVTIISLVLLLVLPASGISISGAKYAGSIQPGTTAVHTMTIGIKSSDAPTDMTLSVMGFGQSMDRSYNTLDPENDVSPYTARPYITLDKTTIHIEPGTTQTVNALISLPANIGAGGRYAIIHVQAIPPAGQLYSSAIDVPVMITIGGTTPTLSGSITGVDAGTPIQGIPVTVTTTFTNTGNYHYYHTVNDVAVTDASGHPVSNVSTAPAAEAIIPGNTVQFAAQIPAKGLQPGTYTADSKVLLEDGGVLDEKTARFDVTPSGAQTVTRAVPAVSGITVSPGAAAALVSSDGRYTVSFPQGAVISSVVVTMDPAFPASEVPPAPSGAVLGTSCFQISGLTGLLSRDATVRVLYSPGDLAAAGGDAQKLKLAYWDEGRSAWVILPTQVNTQDTSLSVTTSHLSLWMVMAASATGSGLPWPLPLPGYVVIAALVLAAVAASVYGRHKR